MNTRNAAKDDREVLLQLGAGAFYRMPRWSRPPHVLKHFLNTREAWWQLGLTTRSRVEALVADFEERGVVCGDDHRRGPLPQDARQVAQTLHDECYEPLYRLVLEGLASGDEHVEARRANGRAGRLDHELLCLTVIYDEGGTVRTAYRTHAHPVSSGLRGRQKNFVRAARLRSSLGQDGPAVDGEKP